jgi:hypothetical protein
LGLEITLQPSERVSPWAPASHVLPQPSGAGWPELTPQLSEWVLLACVRRLLGRGRRRHLCRRRHRPLGQDGVAQAGEQAEAGVEQLADALARPGGEGGFDVLVELGDEGVGVAAESVAGVDLVHEVAAFGALPLALEGGVDMGGGRRRESGRRGRRGRRPCCGWSWTERRTSSSLFSSGSSRGKETKISRVSWESLQASR